MGQPELISWLELAKLPTTMNHSCQLYQLKLAKELRHEGNNSLVQKDSANDIGHVATLIVSVFDLGSRDNVFNSRDTQIIWVRTFSYFKCVRSRLSIK